MKNTIHWCLFFERNYSKRLTMAIGNKTTWQREENRTDEVLFELHPKGDLRFRRWVMELLQKICVAFCLFIYVYVYSILIIVFVCFVLVDGFVCFVLVDGFVHAANVPNISYVFLNLLVLYAHVVDRVSEDFAQADALRFWSLRICKDSIL